MDHDPLTPLFSPLTTLKGVGPTVGALIAKAAGGERVIDLLFHLPESYVDRRERPTVAQARLGQVATQAVEVERIEPPANQRQPWRVVVTDGTGFAAPSRIPNMWCLPTGRTCCRQSSRYGR